MKKILLIVILFMTQQLFCQVPIHWKFFSEKISDSIYEVHLSAILQPGWHAFSQKQPADAIASPTLISFNRNPLLQMKGEIVEKGQLKNTLDTLTGIGACIYERKVEFIQEVRLKEKVATNLSGSIRFQTCSEEECLPPQTISFSVSL